MACFALTSLDRWIAHNTATERSQVIPTRTQSLGEGTIVDQRLSNRSSKGALTRWSERNSLSGTLMRGLSVRHQPKCSYCRHLTVPEPPP